MTTLFTTKKAGILTSPYQTFFFNIEQNFDWLKFSIEFSLKGWYSVLIWDANENLRSQSLLISEPKAIMISACSAEASFASVPGMIPKGMWRIEILSPAYSENHSFVIQYNGGTSRNDHVNKREVEHWSTTGSDEAFTLNHYKSDKLYNTSSRWYKGDFHTHTTESDGKLSPIDGMQQAHKMSLDYFAVTDHNILPTQWVKDEIMVIPGVEITSSKGHFNALGLTKWIDWRPSCEDGGMETELGMNRIIHEVKEAGAIVSINHPMLKPWEWQFQNTRLSDIDVIEIWNDPTYKDNPVATEQALQLWNLLWNDGYRIFGIGGSDSHLLPDESYEEGGPPSVIGDPATFVYCEGLSASSLLRGVKQGHTYVSRGPEYELSIMVNNISYLPGSDLSDCFEDQNQINVEYQIIGSNLPENAYIHWIKNGEIIGKERIGNSGRINKQFTWKKGEHNWLRFETRSHKGVLLSFCNPIFAGSSKKQIQTWKQLLAAGNFPS